MVVIQHDTEIGENVTLRWYAVYQHLSAIGAESRIGRPASEPARGQKIWRKAIVGTPGWILGQPHQVQLDIVLKDDDLKALLGRAPGAPLDPGKPGRTDCVWGACYVYLPASTRVYTGDMREAQRATNPDALNEATHQAQAAAIKHQHRPDHGHYAALARAAEAREQAWRQHAAQARADYAGLLDGGRPLGEVLVVGIDYRQGACTLTSHHPEGGTLGNPVSEAGDYEYGLFDEAMALYPDGAEAGYQLLRFGRILNDATKPADTAHWRQVRLPDGSLGWVNLNAQGATACSDADFPPWQYWRCVDDDQNIDSRCDSGIIKKIVMGDAPYDKHTFDQRLKRPEVQQKLARTLCKMPSEWNSTQIDDRLSWLKQPDAPDHSCHLNSPLDDKSYARLRAHVQKLCFWDQTDLEPTRMWHINPREFVRTMQRCGWLSEDEMMQLFPMTAMRPVGHGQWVLEPIGRNNVVSGRVEPFRTDLNQMCRRYGIVTPQRMAAFYANAMQETIWFGTLHENNPGTRYWPWDGRGFLQLTWPSNYIKYWKFADKTLDATLVSDLLEAQHEVDRLHVRNPHAPNQNRPLEEVEAHVPGDMVLWRRNVADDKPTAADSAGAYWAWSNAAKYADQLSPNAYAFKPVDRIHHAYYKNTTFGKVAATVNVGHPSTNFDRVNGIVARFQAYAACQMVLFDVTAFPNRQGDVHPTPDDYKQRRPRS